MKKYAVYLGLFAILASTTTMADETPPPWGKWAAVAFTRQGGGNIGRAFSENSEFLAKETAIRACHDSECEIKSYVERGCIGIARGYEVRPRPLNWWGFGAARYIAQRGRTVNEIKEMTRVEAREAAKVACDSASLGLNCNVVEDYCTWDGSQTGSDERAIAEWIMRKGGEESPRIQNTLQLINVAAQSYLINLGLSFTQSACLSGRRWSEVQRPAVVCRLSIDNLDRLLVAANPHYRTGRR